MFAFINPIRDEIRSFDLEINRLFCPPLNSYIWGIININGDEIAQLATSFQPAEVVLYKKTVLSPRP